MILNIAIRGLNKKGKGLITIINYDIFLCWKKIDVKVG